MRAGRLRHRVTIQKKEITHGELGDERVTWVDVEEVWAEVKNVRGQDLTIFGNVIKETIIRVWMRYRPDITIDNLIVYKGANTRSSRFSIILVIPDPRHSRLELICKGGSLV
ncbi:phage head closure protein [Arsenophonus nasoniae]|uniref:Phage head closure protein n=1 Tax=Arsenophonus nasoniae TaxID=638 RepID=A0AA95GUG1_9GAMM|nr:phage head closure protein [Arsenophonus nasoniae]WGM00004.1 phage head closure protein [Arsenophonus nasoniae]WGM00197.1 phage head closure protein [Arsenophonus nasoniae]